MADISFNDTGFGLILDGDGLVIAHFNKDENGKDCVEVLDCSEIAPGTPIVLKGADVNAQKTSEIDADTFFATEIRVVDGKVCVNGIPLLVDGKEILMKFVRNGEVG